MIVLIILLIGCLHYYQVYKLEKKMKEYYRNEANKNFQNYLEIVDRYLDLKQRYNDDLEDGDEWKRLI